MKRKLSIYLAGYSKNLEYRKKVIHLYEKYFYFINPMDLKFDSIYKDFGINYDLYLVPHDKKMINQANIVIAKIDYLNKKDISIGTFMEIMYAYDRGIPVYSISNETSILENPWLKYHSKKQFKSIKECFNYLIPQF